MALALLPEAVHWARTAAVRVGSESIRGLLQGLAVYTALGAHQQQQDPSHFVCPAAPACPVCPACPAQVCTPCENFEIQISLAAFYSVLLSALSIGFYLGSKYGFIPWKTGTGEVPRRAKSVARADNFVQGFIEEPEGYNGGGSPRRSFRMLGADTAR